MAKGLFRLTADHYFPGDIYLTSGTLVGGDTPYPVIGKPSFNMVPMDTTAQSEWDEANVGDKPKPEMPAAVLNPTGNNPSQGPRAQTGSVSGPGGVHGARGLAEAPKPSVDVATAKAMAVAAAMIPKEELDKAIEVERARLADIEAAKALEADRAAALAAAQEAAKSTPPPEPPPPAPAASW